jgi:hypothetical protein
MKRAFSFAFALAFVTSAIASCTINFDQFKASGGAGTGATGGGGSGGSCGGQCCTAQDCPAPSDPCKRSTCIASVCGEEPRTDGTAVAMQTAGDCKKAVCQGGAVVNVDDGSDTKSDGNDCTDDVCNGGMPAYNPTMMGAMCMSGGGKMCDGAGHCVACLMDADCMGGVCDMTHNCVPATCKDMAKDGKETDVDCGGPDCSGCDTNLHCEQDTDCLSGVCNNNHKCAAPSCSDKVKNGSETDTDCGGSCPKCDIGQDCGGSDANCKSGNCMNGKCAPKLDPDGSPCAGDATCVSMHCAQGVCCATTCTGTCKSCNVAGMAGQCVDVPAGGADPTNTCAAAQACDGAGNCAKANGEACGGPAECATGNCVDTVCCDAACMDQCKACNVPGSVGKCTDVPAGMQDPNAGMTCVGANVCDGMGACKKANGATCAMASECATGNCVDGVCCDTACGTKCMACTQAKKGSGMDGTCGPIASGTDPDNECGPPNPNCNGMGMCGP